MFDIIFGGKKKLNLTRELVEQRMRSSGFDDLESRLQVKNLSNLQLLGTPEAAVISIIEVTLKLQKKHLMLSQILPTIENHRKKLGSEPYRFNQILQTSQSPNVEEASTAVLLYCNYRVAIENQGLPISDVQIAKIFFQASNALSGFNVYPPGVVDEILDALQESVSDEENSSQSTSASSEESKAQPINSIYSICSVCTEEFKAYTMFKINSEFFCEQCNKARLRGATST